MKRTRLAPRSRVAAHRRAAGGRERSERLSAWAQYVKRDPCAMCIAFPPTPEERRDFWPELNNSQAHHLLPQTNLKALARRMGWDPDALTGILTDSRNGMCLCEFHHSRHTNHSVRGDRSSWRVPRSLLPDGVYDLAAELHIEWLLEQEYPTE